MLNRVIPTSPSSSHHEVGHLSQSIPIRCGMHRFASFHRPCKGFSSRSLRRWDHTGMLSPDRRSMVAHRSVRYGRTGSRDWEDRPMPQDGRDGSLWSFP
jgi:hypothetical protein